jgi:hypothetical protein
MNLTYRKNLLFFSLAVETLMASYGLLLGEDSALASVIYVLAGLVFIFSILMLPEARLTGFRLGKKEWILKLPLALAMVFLAWITSRYWLFHIPIDPDFADMLPVIKVMNVRLLHGDLKHIYDPIPEIWNGTRPIYLPAMWLPYAPCVALGIDMRWITVISILMGFVVILSVTKIRKGGYFGYGQIAVAAVLFWWIFSRDDVHSLISMSEEGVVIFYFVLLTLAISSENAFFMGMAASLCLLSRYSMIGWLLPCLILLLSKKAYKKALIFSGTGLLCLLLLFILPFGYQILRQMIGLPENYIAFANHVWEFTPEVYWLDLGMGKFYGPHRMDMLHHTLIAASFIVPVLFMCYVVFQKKWKMHNINLACFKLSLLVFYQFIDVPYGYLFYTCSFVSLVIAGVLLNQQNTPVIDPSSPIQVKSMKSLH